MSMQLEDRSQRSGVCWLRHQILLVLCLLNLVVRVGVSQTLHFSEMFFLVVFGDKKVSWIPESQVGIHGSWLVQASNSHMTTHVFSMIEYKKCTQTSKIIPYLSSGMHANSQGVVGG
jgi:hypothetical protein